MRQPGSGVPPRALALPVAFEGDRGQLAPGTAFIARGLGWNLALRRDAMTLGPVRMTLAGGHPAPPTGADTLPGKTTSLVGSGPRRWSTHIPLYERVVYRHAWPGIDVVFRATQRGPEQTLTRRPSADLDAVRLQFTGAHPHIDAKGDLHAGPLTGQPPPGARFTVEGDQVRLRADG